MGNTPAHANSRAPMKPRRDALAHLDLLAVFDTIELDTEAVEDADADCDADCDALGELEHGVLTAPSRTPGNPSTVAQLPRAAAVLMTLLPLPSEWLHSAADAAP
jgi:hypothetical protein